jgi:hypothetical protein
MAIGTSLPQVQPKAERQRYIRSGFWDVPVFVGQQA